MKITSAGYNPSSKKQQNPITTNVLTKKDVLNRKLLNMKQESKTKDFMDKEATVIFIGVLLGIRAVKMHMIIVSKLRLEEWELHYGALILLKLKNQQVSTDCL